MSSLASNQPQKFWKESKKLKKKTINNEISSDEFYEHFKNLFLNEELFTNNFVEEKINNFVTYSYKVEELDIEFTNEDVVNAISSLKKQQECGCRFTYTRFFYTM